ncbi:hypothetical protein SAMN02910409_1660 [Prevotellaceae bacterium HUN156]|nr:hypothetical protein SAMN02910409_1660 [Prevotellaceae bacterium HUN156]
MHGIAGDLPTKLTQKEMRSPMTGGLTSLLIGNLYLIIDATANNI